MYNIILMQFHYRLLLKFRFCPLCLNGYDKLIITMSEVRNVLRFYNVSFFLLSVINFEPKICFGILKDESGLNI